MLAPDVHNRLMNMDIRYIKQNAKASIEVRDIIIAKLRVGLSDEEFWKLQGEAYEEFHGDLMGGPCTLDPEDFA